MLPCNVDLASCSMPPACPCTHVQAHDVCTQGVVLKRVPWPQLASQCGVPVVLYGMGRMGTHGMGRMGTHGMECMALLCIDGSSRHVFRQWKHSDHADNMFAHIMRKTRILSTCCIFKLQMPRGCPTFTLDSVRPARYLEISCHLYNYTHY